MVVTHNSKMYYYRGLSTDLKPNLTEECTGSRFLEIDTGARYMFDGTDWQEFPQDSSTELSVGGANLQVVDNKIYTSYCADYPRIETDNVLGLDLLGKRVEQTSWVEDNIPVLQDQQWYKDWDAAGCTYPLYFRIQGQFAINNDGRYTAQTKCYYAVIQKIYPEHPEYERYYKNVHTLFGVIHKDLSRSIMLYNCYGRAIRPMEESVDTKYEHYVALEYEINQEVLLDVDNMDTQYTSLLYSNSNWVSDDTFSFTYPTPEEIVTEADYSDKIPGLLYVNRVNEFTDTFADNLLFSTTIDSTIYKLGSYRHNICLAGASDTTAITRVNVTVYTNSSTAFDESSFKAFLATNSITASSSKLFQASGCVYTNASSTFTAMIDGIYLDDALDICARCIPSTVIVDELSFVSDTVFCEPFNQ